MSLGRFILRFFRMLVIVALILAVGGMIFVAARPGLTGNGPWSAGCPPGFGGPEMIFANLFADEPSDPAVAKLLEDPNFGASANAAGDLREGVVDPRLVDALLVITGEHRICVDAFKEGHYFMPGVEDGPFIPDGYGNAGGLPNTHYHGRAADIWYVDGAPVEGNGADAEVLGVGLTLAGMPPDRRPDQIIGPADWTRRLGRTWDEGWVLSRDQIQLHEDHIHIGYERENGTGNTR